jgi:hypothetical protein
MPAEPAPPALRQQIYPLQLRARALQQRVLAATDPTALAQALAEAGAVEEELATLQPSPHSAAEAAVYPESAASVTRSSAVTQLKATVRLRMAHVPTGIYHLLDAQSDPLVEVVVENFAPGRQRRLRIQASLDGYSANAIATLELAPRGRTEATRSVALLPTLFPEHTQAVQELTRATVAVLVEDLDDGKVETHETLPVWLLARNAAPLAVHGPANGSWVDLSRYFGAFVTPNQREVMRFLRQAADRHPDRQLAGYQSDVTLQVRALFDALKQTANITYVNSLVMFNPDQGARGQRVRLPSETLQEAQANCIDGTLLFASLLEAITLNPALVFVPGHAFVGWESAPNSNRWDYLETTMIGTNDFLEANAIGRQKALFWEQQAATPAKAHLFRRWPLQTLRTEYGVTPLE